jgi:hypothetical protein
MVGMMIKVLVGVVLFVASLVGGLAVTGRLDHDGTANIPLLHSFFPAPPAGVDGEEVAGGETAATPGADVASAAEPDTTAPRRSKTGRSIDGKGGTKASERDEAGSGKDDPPATEVANSGAVAADHSGARTPAAEPQGPSADFAEVERTLKSQGKVGYEPGAYFRFDGMPAGLSADQLNDAWQRVQAVTDDIARRGTALDLREQNLRELADDISRRWKELGEERLQVEQMQRQLDQKIKQFEGTVTLVRNDEAALLKRNADTLAAFERQKAAELIEAQWATERGQNEVLKVLEFMQKDAVNEILAELPPAMVQDVLDKRLRVSKEAVPPRRGG